MHTEAIFSKEARQELKKGIDILADAVKVTLGPQGRPVVFLSHHPTYPGPKVTKDGVTVAYQIHKLENQFQDMGAQLVKAVAKKANDTTGDGTTTATLLTQVIMSEGIKHLDAGVNPIELKRGIDLAVQFVTTTLKALSLPVDNTDSRLLNVATISANNDTAIGELIADLVSKLGNDGLITVEESSTSETYSKTVEGIQIDRGYINADFVTNPTRMSIEFDNPLILLYDRKISDWNEIHPLVESALAGKKSPLVIIAEDVDGSALATITASIVRNGIKVAIIKSPREGLIAKDIMEDIAVAVGGNVISETKGYKLKTTSIDKLGAADKIIITKDKTTIIGGSGSSLAVQQRAELIRGMIAESTQAYEKTALEGRLAKLTNGVGMIYVGGQTELEMKEKKDRVQDALCATLAAVEEGILPGGGVAYIKCWSRSHEVAENLKDGEKCGVAVVTTALREPLMQILRNSGVSESDAADILIRVANSANAPDYGYNAKTMEYDHFYESGVIDPTKVVRVALESAASIAGLLLLAECVVADVE